MLGIDLPLIVFGAAVISIPLFAAVGLHVGTDAVMDTSLSVRSKTLRVGLFITVAVVWAFFVTLFVGGALLNLPQ